MTTAVLENVGEGGGRHGEEVDVGSWGQGGGFCCPWVKLRRRRVGDRDGGGGKGECFFDGDGEFSCCRDFERPDC